MLLMRWELGPFRTVNVIMSVAGGLMFLLALLTRQSYACEAVYRPDCTRLQVGSFQSHELSCNFFYRCDELANPVAHACPPGYNFLNEDGYICAPAALTTCNRCSVDHARCGECGCSQTTPPPCVTTTASSVCPETPTCAASDLGVLKPYPPDCTKYIYCGNETEIRTCPPPLEFSPQSARCEEAEAAGCSSCEVLTSTPATPPACDPVPFCSAAEVGFLKPYPPDCNKYIYCNAANEAEIRQCPSPKEFSPETLYCEDPSDANCPYCEGFSSECPEAPACRQGDVGVWKPYPADCTKYIYCDGTDRTEIRTCPEPLEFSPQKLHCEDPATANCRSCDVSTTLTAEPTPPACDAIPACWPGELGYLKPYPPDCRSYVYCNTNDSSTYSIRSCTAPNEFSPSGRMCVPPEASDCVPCGAPSTPVAPYCPATPACELTDVFMTKPYPEDCTKYIYCAADGTELIRSCPINLEFSPTLSYCVAAEVSDCPYCIPQA